MKFNRKRASFALAILLFFGGCLHSPMPWSPDGKWLAYSVEIRPIDQILQPGWTFGDAATPTRHGPKLAPSSYRLYATQVQDGTSVLLEESPRPITAPGWRPDGRALAIGEVVVVADGKARFDVVLIEGPNNRRVISSRPLPELTDDVARLPAQAIAWSPDGRYLAVPQLSPRGLAILRADNGRQVNAIADAFLPSWSPDSTRLAFYIRGTGDSLQCIDSALGQPRSLAEVGTAGQAPVWTRDALNVIVVTRRPIARGADAPSEQAELVRVQAASGQSETLMSLTGDLGQGRDRSLEGTSVTLDKPGENLFCSTYVEGQPNEITWYRPRENATYKKFSIIDYWTPTGSLSISPDGRTLSARVGSIDHLSPPALCDLESEHQRSKLIAPDDASRVEWIAILVESAKRILAGLPVASTDPGRPAATRVSRPTILPILGEFKAESEPPGRLRKIARMGRPLCDRPADAPPADPAVVAILDEARLFFDYLREDYAAALADLDPLEASAETPERRLELLTIRAQIFLNRGQLDRAARTIAYLRDSERKPARRIEPTATGDRLVDLPVEGRGWPEYLSLQSGMIRAILRDDDPDHVNPDAPRAMFPNFPPGLILPNNFPFLEQPVDPNRRPPRFIKPGEGADLVPKL